MNPYYQIDEEPKKQSRAWIIVVVITVMIAVAVFVWAPAALWSGREPSRETAGVSGDTEDGHDELWESLWGAEDGETQASEGSEIKDIELVSIREYERYTDEILRVMEAIRRTEGETVGRCIGLFDFECDGMPELVIKEPIEESVPEMMTSVMFYELWVYDLTLEDREATLFVAGGLNSLSVLVNREEAIETVIMLDEETVVYVGSGNPLLDASGQTWATVDTNYELNNVMREAIFPETGRTGYWMVGTQMVSQEVFSSFRQEYFRRNRRVDRTKTAIETVWDTTLSDEEIVRRMFDENHEQWFVVAVE